MKTINNTTAQAETRMGTAVIIDVRETVEFDEGHLTDAINLPVSEFTENQYNPYKDKTICLICYSGSRAKLVAEKLNQSGFQDIAILDDQMESINSQPRTLINKWTVDRQFRMTLGVLLAIFLLGYFFVSTKFLIIPIILCAGLVFTSIIDRCYMRMGIAMLPWNRGQRED